MSESIATRSTRAPWHLWLVGVLALLWNAVGAMDYIMTETKNESYMSGFTSEQLAFFYGLPAWVVAAWAVGVWGGVLGSLLLLFKRSLAVWAFLASLIGIVVSAFHNYVLSNGVSALGESAVVFMGVIFLIGLGLYVYSRTMNKRGVLV